jgi:hypothetical protein
MQRLVNVIAIAAVLGTNVLLNADEALWKRVQRLDPGSKVKVTVEGAQPTERYFVQANATDLVVLNLTAPDVPKTRLLEMTRDNPEWMANAGKVIYRDNSIRIGPDGVFNKDRKVCELTTVLERIPREKVTAIEK